MIEASCHCGAVRLNIAVAPDTVTECSCSICRRLGVLWAYYAPGQVQIMPPSGATFAYIWGDKLIEFHTCKVCGCTTHYADRDPAVDRMAVNARLMAPEVVAAARLRKIPGPL